MHIIHIASETAPIAKVGGLGDAVLGLARAFHKLGHQVEIIIPKYAFIDTTELDAEIVANVTVDSQFQNRIYKAVIEEVCIYLIEPLSPLDFFQSDKVYLGGKRDTPRFLYFCKAVLSFLAERKEAIDIIHLHDWHTSLIAASLKNGYFPEVSVGGIVLNIHNLGYQGWCTKKEIRTTGFHDVKMEAFMRRKWLILKRFVLLQAGLVFSDAIIAVSPSYAKEILTRKHGCGLVKILASLKEKLYGILNGIDIHLWDPKTDPSLTQNYTIEEGVDSVQKAKQANKRHLQKEVGLQDSDAPLFACISRLVPQKDPHLIEKGMLYALKRGGQCVLLGSSPTKRIQNHFIKLSEKYKNNQNIHFHFHYNEHLSRLLYAASDFLFMPSYFEPCGISQLIALRYGSVPIVRHTGGLKDTIFDADDETVHSSEKNGFSFRPSEIDPYYDAIDRAFLHWKQNQCKDLIENGMKKNYSWEESAKHYLEVYENIKNS